MCSLLRFFFHLLYNQFSWAYDAVAWLVSSGNWETWVKTANQFVFGQRILELGHGPGHLQVDLARHQKEVYGIDLSSRMSRIARRRLRNARLPLRLVSCRSQYLAFVGNCFDCIVATFPDEYIMDVRTLDEIDRVLKPGGSVVILPYAWLTGNRMIERFLALIYQITHQAPKALHSSDQYVMNSLTKGLIIKGYSVVSDYIQLDRSQLFLIQATKSQRDTYPNRQTPGVKLSPWKFGLE